MTSGLHVRYIARVKTPGVPHHAKAGNLNNAILKAETSGDYILVLDCDMVRSPRLQDLVVTLAVSHVELIGVARCGWGCRVRG